MKVRSFIMRLKDTGLTAQELKDMVNKYMMETYERYDFIAERDSCSALQLCACMKANISR